MSIRKIFIKSNGTPRNWVKKILFDSNFQVKSRWQFIVFSKTGTVRDYFSKWQCEVSRNPAPGLDPEWVNLRRVLIKENRDFRNKKFWIISPLATLYVARMVEWNLKRWEVDCYILEIMPDIFSDDLYLVICPQMFDRLPPREFRMVYQMEQSVTTRWFTDEYLNILYNSIAVFDYSQENIRYVQQRRPDLINLCHVPIESLPIKAVLNDGKNDFIKNENQYEVVFYGDSKNSRRKLFLKRLAENFNVKIINNLYGAKLWAELKKSKIVVNIHYYENSLLETTRINECLSLGLTVISEESSDQYAHGNLSKRVIFTPINDIQAMIAEIKQRLSMAQSFAKETVDSQDAGGEGLKIALNSLGLRLGKD